MAAMTRIDNRLAPSWRRQSSCVNGAHGFGVIRSCHNGKRLLLRRYTAVLTMRTGASCATSKRAIVLDISAKTGFSGELMPDSGEDGDKSDDESHHAM